VVFDRLFENMRQPRENPGATTGFGSAARPFALPHPEESMDASATLANTDVNEVMAKWLHDYSVPTRHWDYWRTAIDL
jgi:hypothetical protein